MSVCLTGMHIAKMYFYGWKANCAQGICDRNTGVCVSPCIDDDGISPVTRIVDLVNQHTFVVALLDSHLTANPLAFLHNQLVELVKGHRAVDIWFPHTEEVQVWSVDDEDLDGAGWGKLH